MNLKHTVESFGRHGEEGCEFIEELDTHAVGGRGERCLDL